jgi:CheY-like chemotaxis protein
MIAPLDDDARLDTVIASGPGLMCMLSRDGRFVTVSSELSALLGARLVGERWSDYIEDVVCVGSALRFEGRVHATDGSQRWLRWSVRGLVGGGQFWVAEDVTASKHELQRVAIVLEVMRALGVGHGLDSIPRLIEALCEADGWVAGELWWYSDPGAMISVGLWPSPVTRNVRNAACSRGDGPVGAAWETEEIATGNSGRATIVAVPILDSQSCVLGVLELRSAEPREVSEPTRAILRYVAFQIGHVVKHWNLTSHDDELMCGGSAYASMTLFTLDGEGRFTSLGGDEALGLHRTTSELLGELVFEQCKDQPELARSCQLALGGREQTLTFTVDDRRYHARFAPLRSRDVVTGVVGALFDVTANPVRVTAPTSRARILIVDDDPPVAAAIAFELTDYDVSVVGSGREAFALLRSDPAFDVVLCDLMMPEVGGMDLFEAIELVAPALARRFVFITGGAFTGRAAAFLAQVANECIEKPFHGEELRAAVARRIEIVTSPSITFPESIRHSPRGEPRRTSDRR